MSSLLYNMVFAFSLLAYTQTFADDNVLQRINIAPDGGPYSNAVSVDLSKAERLIFVSGQVGEELYTGELHEETIEEATRYAMNNIEAILKAAGSDWSNVIEVHIFLRDLNDREGMNKEYRTHFPDGKFPARRTTQSNINYRIEMTASAVVPK